MAVWIALYRKGIKSTFINLFRQAVKVTETQWYYMINNCCNVWDVTDRQTDDSVWQLALQIHQLHVKKSFQFSLFCGCLSTLLTHSFVYQEMSERILGHKGTKFICKEWQLFFKITIFWDVTLYFGRNLLALLRNIVSP